MSERVTKIECKLYPSPTIEYPAFTEKLSSFSVRIDKDAVIAVPNANIHLKPNPVGELLQQEISPLLLVFGALEGKSFKLHISTITTSTQVLKQLVTHASVVFKVAGTPPTDIPQKFRWAATDSTYRDLLDFFTEAQAAPNPRPTGFKMVERLEQKFGNSEQKKNRKKYKNDGRKNACKELHIREGDLIRLITAYPSKFLGDRHAEYDIDDVPARLEPSERAEILTLLKNIIQSYERYVCSKTIT